MTEHEKNLIERMIDTLERMQLDDYVEFVSNRSRMIWNNILYGIMRGIGFSLGFSVLTALVVVIIRHLILLNIPVIGEFLAEVIHAIEAKM